MIDLEANQFASRDFGRVASRSFRLPVEIFASRGDQSARAPGQQETDGENLVLTFEELLSRTPFVADVSAMLHSLQEAYDYPVDVEFAANFFGPDRYKINVVQCRPLQIAMDRPAAPPPESIAAKIAFWRPTAR